MSRAVESFRLSSGKDIEAILNALEICPLDGSHIVTIEKRKSKRSHLQNAYLWLLYSTIAKSGKGKHDVKEDVDAASKYLFRNIWFADDEFEHDLYQLWVSSHPHEIKWYCEHHLHTSALNTKQMAEYLDSILTYFGREIDLPHPEDLKLIEY